VMFFSLSLAIFLSAMINSGRTALGLSLLILVFLTLGLPLLGETVFKVRFGSRTGTLFYMFCPLYQFMHCMVGKRAGMRIADYWICFVGLHALGWACLVAACVRTARCWHDLHLHVQH
jgi:hypothetical protein